MTMRILTLLFLCSLFLSAHAALENISYQTQSVEINGDNFSAQIPTGYKLELLTGDLEGPRLFSFAENGDLFIGAKSDQVYRLAPPYKNPHAFIKLSDYPHSIAFRKNEILIARTSGVYHAEYKTGQKTLSQKEIKLLAALPGGGGHDSRTVAVGPDGRVYLSLGISGNCSNQYIGDDYSFYNRRGGVLVLDESGARPEWKAFATGLRNPVGFDWHPATNVLYASNNGPDHHGYEQPPEYFSRLDANSFHGMPWYQFNGTTINRDTCIDEKPPQPINEVVKPVATFDSRNAPMAVAFVADNAMDERFKNSAIVALRGSWATKSGGGFFGGNASRRHPKIVVVRFEQGGVHSVENVITGFQLKNGDRWARPVGVGIGPDGALYFTSDSGINGLFRLQKIK
ncbi:MAG: PQQ-dependent sugar dehydrogenase [Gammaproteobacteria bacterium]|nr:PQQ-dependent sugar dehydrogenase [Gammaproteobacteria bacterium]